MAPMGDWISVNSTSLARFRWDSDNSTLEVEFNGGRIYQYYEVPQHVFDGLRQADSHGRYFQDHIRGQYRYARL